jgi:hypothetical protein
LDEASEQEVYMVGINPGAERKLSYIPSTSIPERVKQQQDIKENILVSKESYPFINNIRDFFCNMAREDWNLCAKSSFQDCDIKWYDDRCPLKSRLIKIFQTNLCFFPSPSTKAEDLPPHFDRAIELCWEVHRKLLFRLKPKLIICIGVGAYDVIFNKAEHIEPISNIQGLDISHFMKKIKDDKKQRKNLPRVKSPIRCKLTGIPDCVVVYIPFIKHYIKTALTSYRQMLATIWEYLGLNQT